jgi:hypothetical protein
MARGGRTLLFGIGVILILAGGVGGFIWGRQLTYNDVLAGRDLVQQVQSENQTYNRQIIELSTRVTALQSKLAQVQSTLSAIMPADNTYSINPNQSMVVADGRLTIGLIGSPTNEGVNINVDGKQQMVAAGDVIKVAPDPSTNCKVTVQSFDLFKAVVSASCTATKAKAQ